MAEREQLILAVCAVKRGEEGAAAKLYKEFYGDLYDYILDKVKNRELATELTQDTFLEIFDTIESLDAVESFRAWSRQIADRRCAVLFQSRKTLLSSKMDAVVVRKVDDEERKPRIAVWSKVEDWINVISPYFSKLILGIVITVMAACVKDVVTFLRSEESSSNMGETETFAQTGATAPMQTEFEIVETESTEAGTTGAETAEVESAEISAGTESIESETPEETTEVESTETETTEIETVDIPEVGAMVSVGDVQIVWRGAYYEVVGVSAESDYEIVIPSEYDGFPVTSIGDLAFETNYICTLTIPKSIISIGERAFRRCHGSKVVFVEEGNPAYISVSNYCLIELDSKTVILGKTVPADADILYIGDYAYSGYNISSVVIPEGVISLGEHAFEYARSLKVATIPSSVISIGKGAFIGCDRLIQINYSGTMAQWKAIEKGTDWDKYTGGYVVHCTDGDI